jgi:Tetracyclin repressor-like, C-terminal domain
MPPPLPSTRTGPRRSACATWLVEPACRTPPPPTTSATSAACSPRRPEGWGHFADELDAALDATADFVEVGVAYVRAALTHRAHFEAMFRPDLYRDDDPELVAAQERTAAVLARWLRTLDDEQIGPDPSTTATAAWSIVHGFATLWSNGLVIDQDDSDLEPRARAVARALFPNRPRPRPSAPAEHHPTA